MTLVYVCSYIFFGKLNMVICYVYLLLTKYAHYFFSCFAMWVVVYLSHK